MSGESDRLERALEVWLRHRSGGGSEAELLGRHPDLHDLLAAMCSQDGVHDGVAAPATEPGSDDGDPHAAPAAVGERVLGDYRLLREIGRGGMGVVFEARQASLGRRVAVKVLDGHVAANPARLARFRREAQALARLSHPGIVGVLEIGGDGGGHWLAMELIDGESLDDRLRRLRAVGHRGDSLRAMVVVAAEVAEALHHAHRAGIVHRDVKPSNVLLRRDGRAVLGDFGLAREEGLPSVTIEGALAGTPCYMAPELVLHGSRVGDARSDVFSLGATLYEAITLHRPFDAPALPQVLDRILRREPPDPRKLNPHVPADLAAITAKALEKDPARRYQSAGELAADLRAFLELRPVTARPSSRAEKLRRWCKREPLRAALAALLLVGVPVVAGLSGYLLASADEIRAGRLAQEEVAYEDLLGRGFHAQLLEHREPALTAFEAAVALRPRDPEGWARLTLAHSRFDGPEAALTFFTTRWSASAGSDAELQRVRLFLLRRLGRTSAAAALATELGPPRTPLALQLEAAAVAAAAGTVSAGEPAGASARGRELARAVAQASLAVRVSPRPRLLYVAQWALLAIGADDATAREEGGETLVRLWPEHPLAWHVAAAAVQNSSPERALAYQEHAIALGADDALEHRNLAAYLYKCGRPADAVTAARAAVARAPGDTRMHELLVELLLVARDASGMQAACEAWLAALPQDAAAHAALGRCHLVRGEPDDAVAALQRAAELAPQRVATLDLLGAALGARGDDHAALAVCRRVLALAPGHEEAHRQLLDSAAALGDVAAGLAERRRWSDAHADDAQAFAELARFLLALPAAGDAERAEALAAAERADHLSRGEDALVLELLANAYAACGEARAAELTRARAVKRARKG